MPKPLALFEGYGIEIESTVVDSDSLDVVPIVDELLRAAAGTEDWIEDVDDGAIGLSNELVAHVIELKTNGPAPAFTGLAEDFVTSARKLNALLAQRWNARLMPTAMHPWMDPRRETQLWSHASSPVYQAYDSLFDCRRHGWANVQSVHLNLPFADEHEFGRLMAAVRLVLPLIPALAASSPLMEGRATGLLDNRLDVYRTNSARVRAMTGDVIPEPVFGIAEYHERVLGELDRELETIAAPALLRGQEFTNARGAIARFDRMAIEIRLIDAQECAAADLAIAAAVSGVVRTLVEERHLSYARQRSWSTAALLNQLVAAIQAGPEAAVADRDYARAFGVDSSDALTLGQLWRRIGEKVLDGPVELERALHVILRDGTLAQRILAASGADVERATLRSVYRELCDCLDTGSSFHP